MPSLVTVSEFVEETRDDYSSPITSTFVSRMPQFRNTINTLEEVCLNYSYFPFYISNFPTAYLHVSCIMMIQVHHSSDSLCAVTFLATSQNLFFTVHWLMSAFFISCAGRKLINITAPARCPFYALSNTNVSKISVARLRQGWVNQNEEGHKGHSHVRNA